MKKEKVHINLKEEAIRKIDRMHPHKTLLFVGMIGSGILFFFMVFAFAVSRSNDASFMGFQFPKSFVVSTFLMLLSSFSVSKVVPAFKASEMEKMKNWLGITFLLGLIFSACQLMGWKELQMNGVFFGGAQSKSGAYLYVISGLHVAHMIGVMLFLLRLLMECHTASKDSVKSLMYETNPYQLVKLEMLTSFWHFVDVLWVLLFFYFLFTF